MPRPSSPARQRLSKGSSRFVRVLVVDKSRISCQSLKDSLERCSQSVRVAGYASSRAEVMSILRHGGIDVAFVNDDLPGGNESFCQFLRAIHGEFPSTKLVVLLNSPDGVGIVDAFRGGARGVFHRSGTVEALCKCAHAVHEGQIWANSKDLQHVLEALDTPVTAGGAALQEISLLTKRENDAARLVAEGLSNRAIAERLGLTEHTVSNYLFRIYNKLGISTRVELVLYSFNQKREA